mmetsp:Transcript_71466/g.149373  ORF Transcript_71466/g.149373 Transcript_71466/m.149373 type:complete len:729 (-) Transcript_71466:17-2203(-)
MPFDNVPFLHGRYFTYRQYFLWLMSWALSVVALVSLLLGWFIRKLSAKPSLTRQASSRMSEMGMREAGPASASPPAAPTVPTSSFGAPHFSDSTVDSDSEAGGRVCHCAPTLAITLLALAALIGVVLLPGLGLGEYPFAVPVLLWALIFILLPTFLVVFYRRQFGDGRSLIVLGLLILTCQTAVPSWVGSWNVWITAVLVLVPLFATVALVKPSSDIKKVPVWFWAAAVVAVAAADFLVCSSFSGSCLAIYTEQSQGTIFSLAGSAFFSTAWSRGSTKCQRGEGTPEPCYLYLTLAEDASSAMFVNAHFPSGTGSVRFTAVCAAGEGSSASSDGPNCESISVAAEAFGSGYLLEGNRDVHSALLQGLTPNTRYELLLEVEGKKISSQPHWAFLTAPAPGTKSQVQLVLGGDMGSSGDVTKLFTHAVSPLLASYPLAMVIGGDVAYDNGMTTCWPAWDDWMARWDKASQMAGRMIPAVLAVGNHDSGTEAFEKTSPPWVVKEQLPFLTFFPQETAATPSGVQALKDRRGYHMHRIGDVLVLAMDSGYLHRADTDSDQIKWFSEALNKDKTSLTPATSIMASYHVPIYPSTIKRWDNKEWGLGPSGDFVPFFDKYNVDIAFENHVHAFKRTLPLKNHEVASSGGTVYLGDGRAGVSGLGVPEASDLVTRSKETRLARDSEAINHFWLLTSEASKVELRAMDPDGNIFDTCEVVPKKQSIEPGATDGELVW